jgi:glycosyltransferase involved in cell wall biosynthesis
VVPPGTPPAAAPGRSEARKQLGLPEDSLVVAYVGRVTRIKRPDRFLSVAREVRHAVPAARFLVCGDGDLHGDLETAADLGDSLHMLGWRADVETVYAAADMVLLTSDNEGMPVSLIEAGLAGVPTVATDVGSVAEVVQDGQTGLLARPDAEELARHTVRLLRDEGLRRRMGQQASTWAAQQFGAERLVQDTHDLYASIAVAHRWWSPPLVKGANR